MSGLVFGESKVSHHCNREARTGFDAVVTDIVATPENQSGAALLVQSCIWVCNSVCPPECEMRYLAGLTEQQLQEMLRLSQI